MLASHFPAGRVQAPSPSKVVSYTIFGDRKTIPLLRRMQDENVVQLLGILNSRLGSFFFFPPVSLALLAFADCFLQ